MTDVVSEPGKRLSRLWRTESLEDVGRSRMAAAGALAAANASNSAESSSNKRRLQPAAIALIIVVWIAQFLSFSIERFLRDPESQSWKMLEARAVVTLIGILISFAILKILHRGRGIGFVKRATVALCLAMAGATVHGLLNTLVFTVLVGSPGEGFSVESFVSLLYMFSWVYLAVTVILLSLTYGEEMRSRERHIAELATTLKHTNERPEAQPHLWLRTGRARVRVELANIDWVAAEGECVRFYCGADSYLERRSISTVEQEFARHGFVRIHRSAIVNAERIERLTRTRWGALQAYLSGGTELRVSKSFQRTVRQLVASRS